MNKKTSRHGDIYYRAHHFLRDVGILIIYDLEPLGLIPDDLFADFHPSRLSELRAFCKTHPEYHIISFMKSGIMLNYAAPNVSGYMLGEGDPNPRLIARDIAMLRFLSGAKSCPFPSKPDEI